jgi:hypothetical protein
MVGKTQLQKNSSAGGKPGRKGKERGLAATDAETRDLDRILKRIAESDEGARKAVRLALDWRYKAGVILAKKRATFDSKGPKSKAWGDYLIARGLTQRTAANYMRLSAYVKEHPGALNEMTFGDIYRAIGVMAEGREYRKALSDTRTPESAPAATAETGKEEKVVTHPEAPAASPPPATRAAVWRIPAPEARKHVELGQILTHDPRFAQTGPGPRSPSQEWLDFMMGHGVRAIEMRPDLRVDLAAIWKELISLVENLQ